MLAAVIFDLDGTLVTFHFDMKEWRRILLGELERRGFATAGLDLTTPTQSILDAAKSQSARRSEADFEVLKTHAYSVLDDLELRAAGSASPYPKAAETLASLKARGLRLGVLTNSGRKAASESLGKAGLIGFFEFVLTRDDIDTMKPRPDGLLKALSLLKLRGEEVAYVGDAPLDIVAARLAGVRMISVATGNYTAERLRSEGADSVVSSLAELPDLLSV